VGGQVPPAAAGSTTTKARTTRPRTLAIIAALLAGAVVGGGTGAAVTHLADGDGSPASATVDPTTINVNDPDEATTVTAVAASASPSVVTISVASQDAGGTGSGIVLDTAGHVLTNTHVVTLDGATDQGDISVQFSDGRIYSATIVGTDPVSDLAVIQIDGATDLHPATFADSSELNVGDMAIAIGAPLGLSGTVTNGIVSALNRSITVASSAVPDDSTDGTEGDTQDPFQLWGFDFGEGDQQTTPTTQQSTISLSVIQTDAAINPGNSGGALLDAEGNVIGVNVAIASAGGSSQGAQSGSIGVGFAIPANLAQRVADEIIADGSATHGLLGASLEGSASDSDIAGAVVAQALDGPAADAGIRAGDVITKFNGLPITSTTDLQAQVRAQAAGSTVTITYVRDGQATDVEVTLGSYSPE
jgi:putative serine protease PepD